MEQLHFIITEITKNFSQQYDCAMNNKRKIPYFFASQKIGNINQIGKIHKTDRLFTTKFFVLNQECIVSILHKSASSKFLSVKRDVNFSSRKPVGSTFLTFGTRYDEFGRKGK